MALAGVHISIANATAAGAGSGGQSSLPVSSVASQTMASAGTSTIFGGQGTNLLSISASAPIFYATGPQPDPSVTSVNRRYMDPQFGREDIYINAGDKFAWLLA